MGNELNDLVNGTALNPWISTGAIFVVVLCAGLLLRKIIWTRLERYAATTDAKWDDFVVVELSSPVTALIVIAAFGIAGQTAPAFVRAHPLMVSGVRVALIFVAVWTFERAISYFFRSTALPESLTTTTRHLLLTIARAIIFAIGLLIILDTIGVSITPLLASLGVGSVAVALALQDTLSNFFGGLYLLVDKPIRIGDFVRIDEVQGYVVHIGWRSTRLRLLNETVVTLPNNKVAATQLTNFDMPNSNLIFSLDCGVAYGSDLDKVERVAIQSAQEVLARMTTGIRDFTPAVRFHTFADSSINFSLNVKVSRFEDMGSLKHELVKALHASFNREGVDIPFPQRVVYWKQADSGAGAGPA